MEQIVQQILMGTFKNIMECYEKDGLGEIHAMAENLKEISDGMARKMLAVFIDAADRALCDDAKAERKADGFTVKERDVPRTLFTAIGDVGYSRTHFEAKGGGYAYILDHVLGVKAYERVDSGVGARLVNNCFLSIVFPSKNRRNSLFSAWEIPFFRRVSYGFLLAHERMLHSVAFPLEN